MEALKGNKNRLSINLSLFSHSDHKNNNNNNSNSCWAKSTANKSPKSFEPNGNNIVGLGIVAAMNELDQTNDPFFSANSKCSRAAILAVSLSSPRSSSTTTPIPILNNSSASAAPKFGEPNLDLDMELSEAYTCVISHIGNNLIKKREYFDDVLANESECTTASYWVHTSGQVVSSSTSPPVQQIHAHEPVMAKPPVFPTADFLNSCNLCNKNLHGLDIFIYRGEKAFCSAECRCKQISMDEHKEKCGSEAMKKPPPLEYSVSPCSGPMQFLAGVAAA